VVKISSIRVKATSPSPPATFLSFLSESEEETPSSDMCEDTAGYVDSVGFDCSSHIGYDCRNGVLYTEEYGYSLEGWQDMVESCPESCGLCEISGETWECRATTIHRSIPTHMFPSDVS
jgi:hypothetical protein